MLIFTIATTKIIFIKSMSIINDNG